MSARGSTKLRRRVVKGQELTIFRKDWKVESTVIRLKVGRLAPDTEGPGVAGLVEGPEVASLMKGPEAASAVKGPEAGRLVRGPEVVVEDCAVAGVLPRPCFPKILARTTFVLESLPEAKNPGQDAISGGFCL